MSQFREVLQEKAMQQKVEVMTIIKVEVEPETKNWRSEVGTLFVWGATSLVLAQPRITGSSRDLQRLAAAFSGLPPLIQRPRQNHGLPVSIQTPGQYPVQSAIISPRGRTLDCRGVVY